MARSHHSLCIYIQMHSDKWLRFDPYAMWSSLAAVAVAVMAVATTTAMALANDVERETDGEATTRREKKMLAFLAFIHCCAGIVLLAKHIVCPQRRTVSRHLAAWLPLIYGVCCLLHNSATVWPEAFPHF